MLSRRHDALLTCVVVSLLLNALLNYSLSPLRSHQLIDLYVMAGRIAISLLWIQLHQWLTGEEGVDPLINIGLVLLAPWLTEAYWRS